MTVASHPHARTLPVLPHRHRRVLGVHRIRVGRFVSVPEPSITRSPVSRSGIFYGVETFLTQHATEVTYVRRQAPALHELIIVV